MEFLTRYKKILQIIVFLAVVFLLGYSMYLMFFKNAFPIPPEIEEVEIQTSTSTFPISATGTPDEAGKSSEQLSTSPAYIPPTEIAQGGITATIELTNNPVAGIAANPDGKSLNYYNPGDGKFYRIDKDGNSQELSSKVFHNVSSIAWSPVEDKAILEYPDGANILYNFNSEKQVTLPAHWQEFNFSANGKKIVTKSIGLDADNRWLLVSNPDGSGAKAIEPLGNNAEMVIDAWSPNNQVVALYREGTGFDTQDIFFVGQNKENFKSLSVQGRGFEPLWSPQGDRLLYSVYSSANNFKPSLWIVNAQGTSIGAQRKSLKLETWAQKCTFSGNTSVYCAVPDQLEEGAGMFPELGNNTVDSLYKINITTGQKELIAIPDGNFSINKVIVSEDEKRLFFTDTLTGKIYKINLK